MTYLPLPNNIYHVHKLLMYILKLTNVAAKSGSLGPFSLFVLSQSTYAYIQDLDFDWRCGCVYL